MLNNQANAWILIIVLLTAAALVAIIDVCLLIAWALRKSQVDAGLAPPIFAPRWSLVDVWLVGQVVLVVTQIMVPIGLAAVLALIAAVTHFPVGPTMSAGEQPEAFTLILIGAALIAQNALGIAIPAWLITWRYGMSLEQIGIRLLPTRRDLVLGVTGGAAVMLMSMVLEGVLQAGLNLTIGPAATHKLQELTKALTVNALMKNGMDWSTFLVLLLGGAVLAPIGEEFFFRGFLYNSAKRRFGVPAAVCISAAIFAIAHMGPLAVVGIFFMGVVLALAYERTRSLWVTIIMHMVNNGVAIILKFLFPQVFNK